MYDDMNSLGGISFDFATIFITVIFIIVFGTIVVKVFGGISEWSKNEQSHRLTVKASVKSKRTEVTSHMHHHNNDFHTNNTSTTYYVTFEFESGDRTEFRVSGKNYGQLAEGDLGSIEFQGTRFLGFEREKVSM